MADEHQALPVHGYKPQPQHNVDVVNRIKEKEEEILRIIDWLQLNNNVDMRHLSIARTQIEAGFMFLCRSIFQPGRTESEFRPDQFLFNVDEEER